jgi:hypothetical protein
MVTNAVFMGVLAFIVSRSVDYPLRDPDGFLGPAWVRLPMLCVGAFVADILPRTLWRSRMNPTQFKVEAKLLIREHWTRDRIQLVILGLLLRHLRQLPEPEELPALRAQRERSPAR